MKLEEVFIDEKEAQTYINNLLEAVSKSILEGLMTREEVDAAYEEWKSRNLNV